MRQPEILKSGVAFIVDGPLEYEAATSKSCPPRRLNSRKHLLPATAGGGTISTFVRLFQVWPNLRVVVGSVRRFCEGFTLGSFGTCGTGHPLLHLDS